MSRKKPSLGRGLDALLESAQITAEIEQIEQHANSGNSSVSADIVRLQNKEFRELPVEFIVRSKYQPRRDICQNALEELANSIKKHGVMQPIVVRPVADKKFELIAGERRWRACQLANIPCIPVIVKEVSDSAAIAMALIENIQRENLNPMEEADALLRLKNEFNLTQQEVADAVGKSRVTITNLLRLHNLTTSVKTFLEHNDLEMGHARALLSLSEQQQTDAANLVVSKGLSVRQTEALVRKIQEQKQQPKNIAAFNRDPDVRKLEEDLSSQIGAKVEIKQMSKSKGKLIINYQTLDELDGILQHIK
ncbi:MAG: ParB/RepB/Spo0J family partition protein [Endozoicomonadaceae bacterium]|nr:ParB/RepB/Spo0J family partition protein [Endozoicomonadaceae bacterium]